MNAHIARLATDISEALLDATLRDGILRDLPLVGAASSIIGAIRDSLFRRKVHALLGAANQARPQKIAAFCDSLAGDSARAQTLRLKVLEWIEAAQDQQKAELVGELLRLLVESEINMDQLQELVHAVLISFPADLGLLGDKLTPNRDGVFELPSSQAARMSAGGLVEQAAGMPPTIGPTGLGAFRYRMTAVGLLVRRTRLPSFAEKVLCEEQRAARLAL